MVKKIKTKTKTKTEVSDKPALQASTLRPGLLVSVKTSLRGNVSYVASNREAVSLKDGSQRVRWETERTISDPKEHERASEMRTKARNLIARVCAHSAFGLLCPLDKQEQLAAATSEARATVEEFNKSATLEHLYVNVLVGRIEQNDVEAVRAINSEVRDLMADMSAGLQRLDVKSVRDAAQRLRSVGQMLQPDAQVKAQFAIDAAREAAKKIVAVGEGAAIEIDKAAIKRITEQRVSFLDISETVEMRKPKGKSKKLDLAPETQAKPSRKARAPQLELGS